MVIGALTPSSAETFIRNRPSARQHTALEPETRQSRRFPPVASRVKKRATGAPASSCVPPAPGGSVPPSAGCRSQVIQFVTIALPARLHAAGHRDLPLPPVSGNVRSRFRSVPTRWTHTRATAHRAKTAPQFRQSRFGGRGTVCARPSSARPRDPTRTSGPARCRAGSDHPATSPATYSCGVTNSGCSSAVPLAGFSNKSYAPLRVDRKTIWLPSGDQRGPLSFATSNVNRLATPRPTSMSHASVVSLHNAGYRHPLAIGRELRMARPSRPAGRSRLACCRCDRPR